MAATRRPFLVKNSFDLHTHLYGHGFLGNGGKISREWVRVDGYTKIRGPQKNGRVLFWGYRKDRFRVRVMARGYYVRVYYVG